jgi:hypothetical protein
VVHPGATVQRFAFTHQILDGFALPQNRFSVDAVVPQAYVASTRDSTQAQFVARSPGGVFQYANVEQKPDGRWEFRNWGDCVPRLHVEGRATLTWHLDPGQAPPEPGARSFSAMVSEPCMPVPLLGRIEEPIIRFGPDSVLVSLTDITRRRHAEDVVLRIAQSVSIPIGEEFFYHLTARVVHALGATGGTIGR